MQLFGIWIERKCWMKMYINILLGTTSTLFHLNADKRRKYCSKIFYYWKNTHQQFRALRIYLVSASYKNKMKVYVNGNYKIICLWKNLEESLKPNNIVGGKNIIPWKPSMNDSVKPKNCIYKPLKLGYKYKKFILLFTFYIFYNPCQAIVKSQQLRISFDCNFFLAATHGGLRLCREGEGHGPLGLVQEMTAHRLDFNEYNSVFVNTTPGL